MGKLRYLVRKTDQISRDLINSDLRKFGIVSKNLADHAFLLRSGLGFGTYFLKFLALLLILDRTSLYAVYHDPEGLKAIADRVHLLAGVFTPGLKKLSTFDVHEPPFFDIVKIKCTHAKTICGCCFPKKEINLRIVDSSTITVSFEETSVLDDMNKLFKAFSGEKPVNFTVEFIAPEVQTAIPQDFVRYNPYLTHPIFNSYGPAT